MLWKWLSDQRPITLFCTPTEQVSVDSLWGEEIGPLGSSPESLGELVLPNFGSVPWRVIVKARGSRAFASLKEKIVSGRRALP